MIVQNMYHDHSFLDREVLFSKKPRLSVQQVQFVPQKVKTSKQTNKLDNKRRLSQINLRDALLRGLNKQIQRPNLIWKGNLLEQEQRQFYQLQRSQTFPYGISKQEAQNYIVPQDNKQMNKNNTDIKIVKKKDKIKKSEFLPSIIKNVIIKQQNIKQKGNHHFIEFGVHQDNKHFVTLDFKNICGNNKKQEKIHSFKKFKSESLNHLQNKIKLQKKKINNKHATNKILQNSQQKQVGIARQNSDAFNQHKANTHRPFADVTEQQPKKFYINNLNLQTTDVHKEALTRRKFIIKLLQKNQKQLLTLTQNRKNSYPNIIQKQSLKRGISPKDFYIDDNLISKRIVFANPQQMTLKNLQQSIKKQIQQKKSLKNDKIKKNKSYKNKKTKKDFLNGWDIDNQQPSSHIFNQNQIQFQNICD